MHHRLRNISEKAKAVPIRHWVFLAILLAGIFLRTYEVRDWMTFNPDQARDALLVQDMLEGKQWPLMGPQAGNTFFSLGPIFYYFEFASAWLFGGTADRMAYADIFFSIGAIALTYLFFRKFFGEKISLSLTFLFSISFFVVTYSRFAFNPNSIPFFVLLFLLSLFVLSDHESKERLFPAALLGIAMGVGFQLHAILFVAMPFLALLVFIYLMLRGRFLWRSFLVAIAFFFLANAGQAVSEWQTRGANLQSFFAEAAHSNAAGPGGNFGRDLSNDLLCHIQGYVHIISSLGSGDKCDLTKLSRQIEKKGIMPNLERILLAVSGAVFMIGGWVLLTFSAFRESDRKRKRALVLTGAYGLIIFAILFSVSSSLSIRYFIVIEFMPFLLLGLWIRFLQKKVWHSVSFSAAGMIILFLAGLNAWTLYGAAIEYRNKTAGTDNIAVFGEVELMSRYILDHSKGSRQIYLSGKKSYLSRYGKPLEYFAKQEGMILSKAYKKENITDDDSFFYITKKISEKKPLPQMVGGFEAVESATFGNVSILRMIRKVE